MAERLPVAAAGACHAGPCGEQTAEPLTNRKFLITSRSLGCPARAVQREEGGKGRRGTVRADPPTGAQRGEAEFTKAKRRPGVRGRGGAGGAAGWRGAATPARLGALRHSAGQLSGMGWKAGKRPSGRRVGGRCGKQRMGWPAAGGSRHAEPVQGSGAAAVWQRDRRRTYQCVPREHLQQRDEVVSIPQVLVEVVDVTLRLQGWGWRYGGAGGTAEPCRALAPPLLCRPPCLTPAGTKTGQPGWEPSDPPMCSRHSHVSPSAAWCPQRRVPTASTHRHPPPCPADQWPGWVRHHSTTCGDPLPTMPAAVGSGPSVGRGRCEKKKSMVGAAREGETYLCSPVLCRER